MTEWLHPNNKHSVHVCCIPFQLCITINNIEQVRKALSNIPVTLQFNEIQTAIEQSTLPNKPKCELMRILKDSDSQMIARIKQVVDRVADKVGNFALVITA